MSIGKQFLEEFIEIYKNEVALWQVKNDKYRNKEERNKSLQKLLRKTREYEKDANIESVKRKINSIRTSYRREFLKIRKSEKYEKFGYGIYTPTLWYYGRLDFLKDQDIQLDDDSGNSTTNDPLEFQKNVENLPPIKKRRLSEDLAAPIEIPTFAIGQKDMDEAVHQENKSPTPAAAKPKISEEDLIQIAADHLQNARKQPARDEADVYSEGWAMMYRKMDGEQKLYAKRIIDETLMHGQFGQLSYMSSLNFFDGKD